MDEVLRRLETRWSNVNKLLKTCRLKVNSSSESQQFYADLATIKDIVETYAKWVQTEQNVATEFMELSRQLEQCRVSSDMSDITLDDVYNL